MLVGVGIIRQDSAGGDTDCLGAFRSTLFAPGRSALTSPVHKSGI